MPHSSVCAAPALAAALQLCLADSLAAATPVLLWSGADRVAIHCEVGAGNRSAQLEFCARLRRHVEIDAQLPVADGVAHRPAHAPPRVVVLVVQTAVTADARLTFSIRPVRRSAEDSVLSGTVPRTVPFSGQRAGGAAAEAAIEAVLDETLPWRATGGRPVVRPIPEKTGQ